MVYYKQGRGFVIPVFVSMTVLGLVIEATQTVNFVSSYSSVLGSMAVRARTFFVLEYARLFLIGIALYLLAERKGTKYVWSILLGILATYYVSLLDEIFISIVVAVFLLTSNKIIYGILSTRLLVFLGTISYPLYLLHMNLGRSVYYYVQGAVPSSLIAFLASLFSVLLVATMVTYFFERPLQRMMRAASLNRKKTQLIAEA
ncbi:acyltransferase family protein [Planctomycetaceae bacterium SH139]